jgi:hypothetical protein
VPPLQRAAELGIGAELPLAVQAQRVPQVRTQHRINHCGRGFAGRFRADRRLSERRARGTIGQQNQGNYAGNVHCITLGHSSFEYSPRRTGCRGSGAKLKAARRIAKGDFKPGDLPSNREIGDQIQSWACLHEGKRRTENLRDMRLEALRMMRILRLFRPRLIGSALTGHVRRGSDIDLHLFSDSIEAVAAVLDEEGLSYEVERKRVRKQGEERVFVHIHIDDRFPFELTIYASDKAHYVFKSSITGKAIERASIAELEQLLAREYPDVSLEQSVLEAESRVDRFQIYEMLLLPLENVKEDPKYHPEGDALYHSLQVFDHARAEFPYDEEFLLAALLHDVGKAIDRHDHVAAGLEALAGHITPRIA